jgi:uracil-DNA glycosylase
MALLSAEHIPEDWRALLGNYFETPEWGLLKINLEAEFKFHAKDICPEPAHFFKALSLTRLDDVKVVILGQDPYHSPGLAQGLAFSIPAHIAKTSRQFPSSLRNISKALVLEDFGHLPNGDLSHWANQGVLLLNTALSVKLGEAGSHAKLGWQSLIDRLISALSQHKPKLVWMLWGGHAQSKLPLIMGDDHLILQASHPSGLGVYKTQQPFLSPSDQGSCGHFRKTNEWLRKQGLDSVIWVNNATESPVEAVFSLV